MTGDPRQVLRELIDAVWGGYARPSDDPGILCAIADWLDRLDDVADGLGPTTPVSRAMQHDLRRIAARQAPALDQPDGAVVGTTIYAEWRKAGYPPMPFPNSLNDAIAAALDRGVAS